MSANDNLNQLYPINFDFESELKSTLLIKNDDPFMKITIEDDSNDVYMKYEVQEFDNNSYAKPENIYNLFVCPICSYKAGGGCSFQLHTMTHSEKNYYTCNSFGCNYNATIKELVRHIFKDHVVPEHLVIDKSDGGQYANEGGSKKVLKCDLCRYTTTSNGYLRLHRRTHRNM